ncbi:flagellar basal-body rod protein FlgF [Candidatus Sumerlaeota bacterium]|nr:flagellar basal-body rod protein FlgF [Candidatus Sumerlaeota bacterium]
MKEMYVSLSAAVGQEKHLAVVANNLANVNSVGFKKDTAVFQVRPPNVDWERMERSADPELDLPSPRQRLTGDRNYVTLMQTSTDFSEGSLRSTSDPFNVAIEQSGGTQGAAFFAVETPQGERYTRAGAFQVSREGELVTPDGYRVLSSSGGAIQVGDATPQSLSIGADGKVASEGTQAGALRLVWVSEPNRLEKIGNGLFSAGGGRVVTRDVQDTDPVQVRQGFLEYSNVNIVEELVRMIELQRSYEASQKVIQTMSDASSKVATLVLNG